MLKSRFIAALGAVAMLSSCQSDDNMALVPDSRIVALSIDTSRSRASIDEFDRFRFASGDQFCLYSRGLASDMNAVIAIYDGNNIAYDGQYHYSGTDSAAFYAAYPATAAIEPGSDIGPCTAQLTVDDDQSIEGNFFNSHLLWCKASGKADAAPVCLKFSHAMSLVKVVIADDAEAESVTIEGVSPTATIDMQSGLATAEGEPISIKMHKTSDKAFRALIPPQCLQPETFSIVAAIGADKYKFNLENQIELTSGHACRFNLTPSTDADEYVHPENSLIPYVEPNTKLTSESSQYTMTIKNSTKWKRGEWFYNSVVSKDVTSLPEGGGFNATMHKYKKDVYEHRCYLYPSLAYYSNSYFDLTKHYKLTFEAMSEKDGKIGTVVYGMRKDDTFCYHATSTDGATALDSKDTVLEHETNSEFRTITIYIDPSEGGFNYTNNVETGVQPNYFKNNTTDTTVRECVLVFYNPSETVITYTIKNISIVPID